MLNEGVLEKDYEEDTTTKTRATEPPIIDETEEILTIRALVKVESS